MINCKITAAGGDPSAALDVRALIDSGATDCHIREELRIKLGAEIIGQVHATAIGSEGVKPICQIDLIIPAFDAKGTTRVNWAVAHPRTIIDSFDPHCDIIIGMNVIILQTLVVSKGVPTFLVG